MTLTPTETQRGRSIALGFGTAVLMWAAAYIALMKPGMILGEFLFAITLLFLLGGGFLAGKSVADNESAWAAGVKVGLVTATVNLLILGSLIGEAGGDDIFVQGLIWVAGNYGISIVLASVGAMIGARWAGGARDAGNSGLINWRFRFACVAIGAVVLLLISGGLVTGLEAGLAVPDWPNSFGHNMLLYPLSEMTGDVFYEHAHRLYGTLVGVTAITLVVTTFVLDRRPWMHGLTLAWLLLVIVQGILGGTRVTETSTALAVVHGVFGQIVLAMIAAIAAFTSTSWKHPTGSPPQQSMKSLRIGSTHLVVFLVLQLVLGAMYRHLHNDPDLSKGLSHGLLGSHVLLAALLLLGAIVIGGRAWAIRNVSILSRLGVSLLFLIGLQVMLGVGALVAVFSRQPDDPIPFGEVVITSAHQATGAFLLATITLLAVWVRRFNSATH